MPIVLYRVDERLIHGQVVVGWGSVIAPELIVVVDDDLAASSWEQDLYTIGVPPGIDVEFCTVTEARERLDEWRRGARRVLILTPDVRTMRRLAEGGRMRGEEVNLGGIHFAPGRREVLPYLHLSPDEEFELRVLEGAGTMITARDLPSSRRVPLGELLRDPGRPDSYHSGAS